MPKWGRGRGRFSMRMRKLADFKTCLNFGESKGSYFEETRYIRVCETAVSENNKRKGLRV